MPNAIAMEFSPDGKRLLLTTQAGLTLWDIDGHRIAWDAAGAEQGHLAFGPDGRLVATGGVERVIVVRDADDGTVRFRMSGHRSRLHGLAFSPDGRTLASADSEGSVKFWNVATGQELFDINHADTCADAALEFSADGRNLFLHVWPQSDHANQDAEEIKILDASEG